MYNILEPIKPAVQNNMLSLNKYMELLNESLGKSLGNNQI